METGTGQGLQRRQSTATHVEQRQAWNVDAGFHTLTSQRQRIPGVTCALSPKLMAQIDALCSSSRWRVVLVADCPAVRRALQLYLTLEECKVAAGDSYAELQELLDRMFIAPDAIIADVNCLSSRGNFEIVERIRGRFNVPIPAIILVDDAASVPAALAAERYVRYVEKPVDGAALTAVMNRLVCGY